MKHASAPLSKMSLWLLIGALGLAACSPGAAPTVLPTELPTQAPPTTAPTAAPTVAPTEAATEASLKLASNATLGQILVDAGGHTLYAFMKDAPGTTNCYDKCQASWPPVLTLGQPQLADGLNISLTATTQRKEGTVQLTYNGWPLYRFAGDAAPGDVTGQGLGKVWWVVSAEGNPIRPAAVAVTQTAALGTFLTDASGRALYVFFKDAPATSNCYDKCEQSWPPLLSLDAPTLGPSVDATLIGTTKRKDGTSQLTYNGAPLYYFAKDAAPGDTLGQGLGKVWYVVGTDGKAIVK